MSMRILPQDLREAFRALARKPGATFLAIASLAIAIGLSTAAFSVLDAYVLRDLPVSDPSRLVSVGMKTREQRFEIASWPEYQALATKVHSLSGIAAEDRQGPPIHLPDGEDFPITAFVSDNYFDVLGVQPARGDLFHAGRGQDATVVLSYHYWKDRLASDPNIVGRILSVGSGPATLRVIGIAAPGFTGTVRGLLVDLFVPPQTFFGSLKGARPDDIRYTDYELVGRLRPTATLESARAESEAVLRQLERDGIAPAPDRKALVEPFTPDLGQKLESNAVVLGMIVLLIIIAAANLANLRLVDNETRRHETGIRLALGAGRITLARQHLTETLLLAGSATGLGVLLAIWLTSAAPALFYSGRRYIDLGIRVDARTLAFSSGALLLVALVGAFIPLNDSWRHRVIPSLQPARATHPTRWLTVLVIAQMTVVTAVTCSAGLLWRSLEKISAVRPAMDPDRSLLLVQGGFKGASLTAVPANAAALAELLTHVPGVQQVAWARRAMLSGSGGGSIVNVEMPGQPKFAIPFNQVSPNYFAATGARILSGRGFGDSDGPQSAPVILASRTFARRFFPGRDALGQWVRIAGKDRQIVGIVEDGPQNHLLEQIQPFAYFPFSQRPQWDITFFVETGRDPGSLAAPVRAALRRSGNFTMVEMTTMHQHMRMARSGQEIRWQVAGALAFTGLLLAAAGLFGVTGFAVARRTAEFGVRVAMGATPRRLVHQVLGEAAGRIAIALPLGWLLAWLARHAIAGLLYSVAPDDPPTFAAAGAIVSIIGCLAALHPALRAARTDPAATLRQE